MNHTILLLIRGLEVQISLLVWSLTYLRTTYRNLDVYYFHGTEYLILAMR